ncbi:MAG: hypothetical protein GY952_21075 [Rhodobacteraceae bacterium]|nr:hypothetical protein [Paracoccaceae bacterium]
MRSILVVSAGLLVACSEIPVQKAAVGGQFVDAGPAEFAVFSNGPDAMAIYLGALRAPDEGWVLPAAGEAIKRATGCLVIPETLHSDTKTIRAQIDCSRLTAVADRASEKSRGRTARSGSGPPQSELARRRLEDDAEE